MKFNRNQRLSENSGRSKEIKEIKENYQNMQYALCIQILYLNSLSFRFDNEEKRRNIYGYPYFIKNQLFKDISIRRKEKKDIKESFKIPAIWVVKFRYSF